MATRKQTEAALRKLIQNSSPLRAVAITGQWGCGKTHLVNTYLKSAEAGGILQDSDLKFVYVSLFGLTTLSEVRRRISTIVVGEHAERLLGVATWISGKVIPQAASEGLAFIAGTANAVVEDKVTRRLVVCFDDLERVNGTISESDLFGLISELTEQRECKCILIFNREKLDADAKSKTATQEEKIFDLVLDYRPTIAENLVHGIEDKKTRELVEPVFEAFENSNIRIMRRLTWVLEQITASGAPNINEVKPRLLRNAAVLCIVKYACADSLSNLDVLCEPNNSAAELFGYSDFAKEVPESLRVLLKTLDHTPADFDKCIVGLLTHGALDESSFAQAIANVYEEQRHNAEREELHSIWESLRQGFDQTSANFGKRLTSFLNKKHESIHPKEIASLCDLLLTVAPSVDAQALVRQLFSPFIRGCPTQQRAEVMKTYPAIELLKIHEAEPYSPPVGRRSLSEVFEPIAGRLDSWDSSGSSELDGFSDEEIETFLLGHKSPIAFAQFKNLLERVGGNLSNPTEKAKQRHARLSAILDRIAARDPLYHYQIKTLMPKFH